MMKKLILCILLALFGINIHAEVKREGNIFKVEQTKKEDKQTGVYYQDKDSIQYIIYASNRGSLYIKRISKKTGKEYKYYLPKDVQETIKKELNIQ